MLTKRKILGLSAGLAAVFACGGTARARSGEVIKLGFAPWTDAEFVTKLAAKLIEDRLGLPVELVQTDVAPLYHGIMRGDLDAVLMCWLPKTHADFWKRAESKVERLGTLYSNAKMGFVVPAYVPESEVSSIADLAKPDVRRRMGGRVQTIEPGAGMTQLVRGTVEAYGLDYTVQESGEAAMLSVLHRAIRGERWIVASGWNPHWMFNKYELRYLADPKMAMGGPEEIVAAGRLGLRKEQPKVAAFLSRMNIPLNELEAAMLMAQEKSHDEAVARYSEEHAERVNGWFAEG